MNPIYFVFYKSNEIREWIVDGPMTNTAAYDFVAEMRSSAAEIFVAMRHFDGTMSIIEEDELVE